MKNIRKIIGILGMTLVPTLRATEKRYRIITTTQPKKKKAKNIQAKNHKSKPSTKYKGTKPIVSNANKQFRRKS